MNVAALDFEFLFKPVEDLDAWLTGLFEGAPLPVALGIAFVLGLRHASDPDHLVAVTSLVAADDGDARRATKLGAWWGTGTRLDAAADRHPANRPEIRAAGLARVGRREGRWGRDPLPGDPRHLEMGPRRLPAGPHGERAHSDDSGGHRHLHRGEAHAHAHVRTSRQAFGIGLLHGLAGTGAVVVLLLAALPGQLEAALALGCSPRCPSSRWRHARRRSHGSSRGPSSSRCTGRF